MTENPLRQKLLKLAEDLIDEVNAVEHKAAVEVRVDVLKASTILYLGDEKVSAKVPEDAPTGRGMSEWRQAIHGERPDA
jgi:hypothetical protein